MKIEKQYRKNVAIMVLNRQGLLLACHRSDIKNAWQIPQGGIEKSETAEEAMFRELEEEIGTAQVTIIDQLPFTIRYDWPEELYHRGYHGQEQTYFLVQLDDEQLINLEKNKKKAEFNDYQWVNSKDFLSLLSSFKKESYQKALQAFKTRNAIIR